jgi:AcrR family transcriptional regulator
LRSASSIAAADASTPTTEYPSRAKAGLTLSHVVTAAFAVLDDGGLAKLSTRAIAAQLGVSMNTVMWHIGTKDRLLGLMAEAIVGRVDLAGLRGSSRQHSCNAYVRPC